MASSVLNHSSSFQLGGVRFLEVVTLPAYVGKGLAEPHSCSISFHFRDRSEGKKFFLTDMRIDTELGYERLIEDEVVV